jgi:hypothetical protein
MLDHDELLPEEQAYPGLVQELRSTYQMKPEEKQVLSRVYERLAQSADSLPLLEPIQLEGHTQPQRLVLSLSPPTLTRFKQSWLRRLNILVAVLITGLLVGSLAFIFSIICHTSVGCPAGTAGLTNGMRVVLVPAQRSRKPSQAEMEATRDILTQRFTSFGLPGASVSVVAANGQPAIQMELPLLGGKEQQAINMLLETGVLEFWNTGARPVQLGLMFDCTQFLKYNPGCKAQFAGTDLDPSQISVGTDQAGRPSIFFEMKGSVVQKFGSFTQKNVGNYLTVTLDRKVIESAVIESAITGQGEITGSFTSDQANALVSVLKYGPLPVALKKLG